MPPEPASILVTDAEARSALAVVRSLGMQGHIVHTCSASREAIASSSRFARESHIVPDPRTSPEAFAAAVMAVAKAAGIGFVLPISDASCAAILPPRHLFPCQVLGPTADSFLKVSDKAWLLDAAGAFGLIGPPQLLLEQRPAEVPPGAITYPVVLKPHRSVAGGRTLAVAHAADADEVVRRAAELPDEAYPLLVQQRIVGPGRGIFLLRVNGRVIARFAHRRLYRVPAFGGPQRAVRERGDG